MRRRERRRGRVVSSDRRDRRRGRAVSSGRRHRRQWQIDESVVTGGESVGSSAARPGAGLASLRIERSCVFGLGASSYARQVFDDIPHFHGAGERDLKFYRWHYRALLVRALLWIYIQLPKSVREYSWIMEQV
ncbi:uncharacterized protein LOC120641614 [Panicum virgatum]|uniref:uncharacterized protein LOC120641614 n=1 Tax=Panicum virgatum TaxID=38727 RepID=UPI0019D643E7|nr:uncharacterized protein LOC120641614 [Panicum virgatum]